MEPEGVPALVEALFIYRKAEGLDKSTKRALRLCNKHFKNLVDATVTAASVPFTTLRDTLNPLNNTEWPDLKKLRIFGDALPLTVLPSALFVKISRLETLKIDGCMSLTALPEEIEKLSHLKSLHLYQCYSLLALPSSFGQLTALEKIDLFACSEMAVKGLAPLQHLTGLTSLKLAYCIGAFNYPDFIWNLTSLKELTLYTASFKTLPDALGNLTNLESLEIGLPSLTKLPESVGNLNALKWIDLDGCYQLTTLPESLDDLLWRKAHETGESKMERVSISECPNLVFSPKMKQALELLEHNGVEGFPVADSFPDDDDSEEEEDSDDGYSGDDADD